MAGTKHDIKQQQSTFRLELVRAVPQGLIETAGSTFAMYVAVTIFDVPMWMKMAIAAAASLGLLLSLFTVQMVRRVGCTVNTALVLIWILAAAGFSLAAISGASAQVYLIGVCLAAVMLTLGSPLIAQIYRKHYTNKTRGQLFAVSGVVRASTGALMGMILGNWLAGQEQNFHVIFWGYAMACLIMAGCAMVMAKVRLRKTDRLHLFDAFQHVHQDKAFRKLLGCWFLLGMGNLLCFSLFVEFISNPTYGFELNPSKAAFVTSTIPMLIFVIFVIPWGIVFDKMPFYRVRVITNVFFLAGILVYFLGGNYLSLCIGIALHGIGRSGGNILWSLWVTKFAHEDHVGEYMSVHTYLTGVRGTAAPIFAFIIAGNLGVETVAVIAAGLIVLSSALLWPELKAEWIQEK
jgi:MFS family permease